MASIAPTCSPTSLQLRLAFNAPKFPVTSLHSRRLLRHNNHHPNPYPRVVLRPLRAAEQNPSGPQLVGSDPKSDGFSGWSDEQPDDDNSHKKKEPYGGE